MRHKVARRKLNLPTDQRMALLKNQVQALFMHERVVTTEARAKEVRALAEKLITKAKVDTVANRRYVERYIQKPPVASESKEQFAKRKQRNPLAVRKNINVRAYREAEHPEREILSKLFTDIAPRYAPAPRTSRAATVVTRASASCRRAVATPHRRPCSRWSSNSCGAIALADAPLEAASTRYILFVVAYDGTDFCGSQRQKNGRSVQGELERALEEVLKHPAPVVLAGRTDAGVHATGQVGRFSTTNRVPASECP
jgi:ribosomal protein L17